MRHMLSKGPYTEVEIEEHKKKYRNYINLRKSGWENKPWNEFLSLVTQRPDPELTPEHPVCPFCSSSDIAHEKGMQTLVGSSDPDDDPNHHWDNCECRNCHQSWMMEYKGLGPKKYNVWYTKNGRILKGIPSCFESYIYTCSKCGGDVFKKVFNKGTKEETTIVSCGLNAEGVWEKFYDTYYICQKCKSEVKITANEYWTDKNPNKPHRPMHPLNVPIYEEAGVVVVNDYAVKRINLK